MLIRRLLLRFSFVLGLFGIVSQAHAQVTADQNPLPLSSSNWTASEANGNFLDTGTSGQHQIALVLPQNSRHFEVSLSGFQATVADGTNVSFTVTFDNGQSLSFSGLSNSGEVKANLNDGTVTAWTHNITADQTMTITFAGITEDPWAIPLTGTTPTITAMAKAIKMAGIDGLPGPWSIGADNSSATTTSEPLVTAPSASSNNVPGTDSSNTQGNSEILAFSDPDGIKYANAGETSWITNTKHNDMTDVNDISVVSVQENDSGARAQVFGTCSNKVVIFKAIIVDQTGQGISLANETLDDGENIPGTSLPTPSQIVGALGTVRGLLRINSNPAQQNLFFVFEYDNEPQLAELSLDDSTGTPLFGYGRLDLRTTWRILAQFDTHHGTLLIKIPLYDRQIENFIKNCVGL
jgi:hypothetical protein